MTDEQKPAGQGPASSSPSLVQENQRLKAELAALQQTVVAEKGPAQGTEVCFQKHGESFCRPAVIASEGFTDRVKRNDGTHLHALVEYGEPPWTRQSDGKGPLPHTFQTDRPWNPLGLEETWHLPDECPRAGKGCPFGQAPDYLGKGGAQQAP